MNPKSLWQQLVQLAHRYGRNAGKNAAEVRLGIDGMTFGAGDEAVERGNVLGGFVMAGEEPVLAVMASFP